MPPRDEIAAVAVVDALNLHALGVHLGVDDVDEMLALIAEHLQLIARNRALKDAIAFLLVLSLVRVGDNIRFGFDAHVVLLFRLAAGFSSESCHFCSSMFDIITAMTIETTTRVWREGKHYIAHALPLDVASSGDSPEAARRALREAVELFVATAREHGTLDDVLDECGYRFEAGKWVAPQIVEQQQETLAV